MFGFTKGCLPMHRWDELKKNFANAGAKIIFGLNALAGKSIQSGSAVGPWNYTNAESFIRYTVSKNYTISGGELGNELSGKGIGTSISADQYASDLAAMRDIVYKAYENIDPKPLIIAPGGVDEHLVEKILNPLYLDGEAHTFADLKNVLANSGTSATSWVGESGGAYNSGRHLVSDAFVCSFWYLDQLGMSATYDTKTYCRQSLIGGNYCLLNTTNFIPNPDYYSALLWHRLMGRGVLSTTFTGTSKIRAYAHCAKQSKGITILLMNLDNSTAVETEVTLRSTKNLWHRKISDNNSKVMKLNFLNRTETAREEYHLTPHDGNIHSQIMFLNGNNLTVNSDGEIPSLQPIYVNSSNPIIVAPFSIVFIHIPDAGVAACR
ncbi:hypothetical protein TanjilG_14132 [Lupinus angustifolius]|uniref:Uncharacterized protein n=1 Tax=Lupinus angustifolius TaxID=3871 RepID=A0A1J7ILJ6_LUPAN|nr:hypothetical protein TanjilG_14132 [Lupinus angustifolius]